MGAGPKPGAYVVRGLFAMHALMALDQLSKWWILDVYNLPAKGSVEILPFFSLTMVWNTGISMGLPLGDALGRWGIVAMTMAISVWLLVWLKRSARAFEATALVLILSGALGNLIDRFAHGAVVDFIHLHAFDYSFYVFNVADSAITIGFVMLLIDGLRDGGKSPKNASNNDQGDAGRQGDVS